jgi:hypothetical protein
MYMTNEYEAAASNLVQLGVQPGDIELAVDFSRRIVQSALASDSDDVDECASLLANIFNNYGLDAYFSDLDGALSMGEAVDYIDSIAVPGKVIGLSGKPGSGKSTLLTFLEGSDYSFVDEFWNAEEGFEERLYEAQIARDQGEVVIVAASQLESDIVDLRLHLSTSSEARFHNLSRRNRDLADQVRVEYFDAFELVDNLLYESERVKAIEIVDASTLRY